MQGQTGVTLDFPFPNERVFRYQAMQDILHHLVNNPFERFTQRELATMIDADVSSVSRAVDLLEQLGVVTIDGGKPARIRIDQAHLQRSDSVFAIPQQHFRKPVQKFLDEIARRTESSEALREIVGVVLFGSVARGEADRSSDLDLLVIVDGDATVARRVVTKTARELEDQSFDGDRYEFEVLIETPESAISHSENLREIFDDGLVLARTDSLSEIRRAVYDEGSSDISSLMDIYSSES